MTRPSVLSEVLKAMRDRLPRAGVLRLDSALVGPAVLAEVVAMEGDGLLVRDVDGGLRHADTINPKMWEVFFDMGIVPADIADRLREAGWQPMKERQ